MSFTSRLATIFLSSVLLFSFTSGIYAQDSESSESSEATAESDDTWYYGKVIKSVTFKGLKSVSSKDV